MKMKRTAMPSIWGGDLGRVDFRDEDARAALRQLPERPYQFALWKTAKVNIDYHVAFEKHFYSVPHTLIQQQVEIKATERMVEIFHKGKQVAIHPRSSTAGRYSTLNEHMPDKHKKAEGC